MEKELLGGQTCYVVVCVLVLFRNSYICMFYAYVPQKDVSFTSFLLIFVRCVLCALVVSVEYDPAITLSKGLESPLVCSYRWLLHSDETVDTFCD
jgi:hypothetical protein